MSRSGLAFVGAIATASALTVGVAFAAPDPARVQASADEFTLVLSRMSVPAGRVIVELVNYGEDDHDLALRRRGGVTKRIGVVRPGELGDLETTLRPGRYAVWCTLADHRVRGMRTTLVVRSRSPASVRDVPARTS